MRKFLIILAICVVLVAVFASVASVASATCYYGVKCCPPHTFPCIF